MSQAPRIFVDTNVFIYSVDPTDQVKQDIALRWIDTLWLSEGGRISWQVLHEFYVTASRKVGIGVPRCREIVESLKLWHPGEVSFGLIERAWYWTDTAQLTYWDSLILASAERQSCQWLLTEDFSGGRKYGDVTAINPFQHSPESIGLTLYPRRLID
jgi:predicted nucleic acid-binding protein